MPSSRKKEGGSPDRIRTGVSGVRGQRPGPLDDGAVWLVGVDGNAPPPDAPKAPALLLRYTPKVMRLDGTSCREKCR